MRTSGNLVGAVDNVAVSADKRSDSAPKYPLGVRLKAWWSGEETAEVFARGQSEDLAGDSGEFDDGEADGLPSAPKKTSGTPIVVNTDTYWAPARIAAAQMVWGKGFAGPGDEAYLMSLVNVAGLKTDMSILDLSAGLGGAARALSERFGGLWINAFEMSPELAQVGMEQSKMAGMTKKVPLESFDPAKPHWKKKFDFAFARETFYQIKKKEILLLAIAKSLKPTGQCLLTDLVLREEGLSSPELDAWKTSEPNPVYPWSVEQYRTFFEKLSLPMSLSPLDLTEGYCNLVVSGWWKAQNTILRAKKSGNYDEEVLATLGDEVERWAARTAAMQSGDLRVFRFYSDKRRR